MPDARVKRVAWEPPYDGRKHFIAVPVYGAGSLVTAVCGAQGVTYFGTEPNPASKCLMCDDLMNPSNQEAERKNLVTT